MAAILVVEKDRVTYGYLAFVEKALLFEESVQL